MPQPPIKKLSTRFQHAAIRIAEHRAHYIHDALQFHSVARAMFSDIMGTYDTVEKFDALVGRQERVMALLMAYEVAKDQES